MRGAKPVFAGGEPAGLSVALIHLPQSARIEQFLALERQVSSLPRAVDFYVRGLGFSLEPGSEVRHTALDSNTQAVVRLGDERIVLCSAKNAGAAGAPRVPGFDVRFQHAAIVVSDMAAACQRLQACSPEAISLSGPQLLPPDSGGVTAFKFRDPDGNALELIFFPQLPERWRQRVGASPTLGIDHAAISVAGGQTSSSQPAGAGAAISASSSERLAFRPFIFQLPAISFTSVPIAGPPCSGGAQATL